MTLKVVIVGLFLLVSFSASASLTYAPLNLKSNSANLVVVLHGCLQSPEMMALGTGWNEIADKNNLVVLYPKAPDTKSDSGCWNWFLEENQAREAGELKFIKTEIEKTVTRYRLNKPNIFVNGISSGGAAVAGLLACFPNYFSGAGLQSALSYGLAINKSDAQTVMANGPSEKKRIHSCNILENKTPIIVIHGKDDKVVNLLNANRIIEDFIGVKLANSTETKIDADFKYEISIFEGKKASGNLVLIEGLGHAWSGYENSFANAKMVGPSGKFPTILPFFQEKGPSSTNIMWNFFKKSLSK